MTEEKEPRGFDRAKKKTEALLSNHEKIQKLLSNAKEKASEKQNKIKDVWNDFQTLLRLVQAYWKKEYTKVPWKTVLYAASAIFYFVTPLDFIPDFIPISGFLDDITVISFVIKSMSKDIQEFKDWEQNKIDEK